MSKWYKVSLFGKIVVSISTASTLYFVVIFGVGIYDGQENLFILAVISMYILAVVSLISFLFKIKPFKQKHFWQKGFSLVELLIVISIIGILSSIVIPVYNTARGKAHFARTQKEFKVMEEALQFYLIDHGEYPPDAVRNIPAGLEVYLGPGEWPDAPYPDSVYDWENWDDPDTGEKIYQISVRFCPSSSSPLEECNFPSEDWAENFDQFSAAYYCFGGSCRSHIDKPIDHPGYCLNCGE